MSRTYNIPAILTFAVVVLCFIVLPLRGQGQPPSQTKIEVPGVVSYTMLIEIGDGGGAAVSSQVIQGYQTFNACALATQELIRQKKVIGDNAIFHLYCIPTNTPLPQQRYP